MASLTSEAVPRLSDEGRSEERLAHAVAVARVLAKLRCVFVKLKTLIGFYMIATKIDKVYEVELPAEVKDLLSTFSVGVSFGFSAVGSVLECLDMRGYPSLLAVHMAVPAVVALLIVLVSVLRVLRAPKMRTLTALLVMMAPYLLQLAFLAYPLVTNVAFEAFSCYPFEDAQFLKADVAIVCGTTRHEDAKALAWVAIAIYPFGLLAANAALLFAARKAITTGVPLSASIS